MLNVAELILLNYVCNQSDIYILSVELMQFYPSTPDLLIAFHTHGSDVTKSTTRVGGAQSAASPPVFCILSRTSANWHTHTAVES